MLAAYRATYLLPEVTLEQAKQHLELERRLTAELLASTAKTRRETFEQAYSTLYSSLPWLNTAPSARIDHWVDVLGPPPRRVYEVGSGYGNLVRALAERGYQVEATDITAERGDDRLAVGTPTWTVTDGVHLSRFAANAPYDAVISDQLIEHLHPDDILLHLTECRKILKPGRTCAVRTPHAFTGPHDVSRIFGFSRTVGMHLHEYTNQELARLFRQAGFAKICAAAYVPARAPIGKSLVYGSGYMRFLVAFEAVLSSLPTGTRAKVCEALRGPLKPRVFIVAKT